MKYKLIFIVSKNTEDSFIKVKKETPVDENELASKIKVSLIMSLKEDIPYGIPLFISGYQSGHIYSLTQLPHGTPFHKVYNRKNISPSMIVQFALEVVSPTEFN